MAPSPATFRAPWSRSLLMMTVLATVVMVGVSLVLALQAMRRGPGARHLLGVPAAITIVTLLLSAALAPRRYTVGAAGVAVERWLGSVRIPRASIRGVEILGGDAFKGAVRTFGVGGLFGFYGRFRSPRLGPFRLYACRSGPAVAIRTVNDLVVVTPDRPEDFVAAVLTAMG
jgi:hypothetical protein